MLSPGMLVSAVRAQTVIDRRAGSTSETRGPIVRHPAAASSRFPNSRPSKRPGPGERCPATSCAVPSYLPFQRPATLLLSSHGTTNLGACKIVRLDRSICRAYRIAQFPGGGPPLVPMLQCDMQAQPSHGQILISEADQVIGIFHIPTLAAAAGTLLDIFDQIFETRDSDGFTSAAVDHRELVLTPSIG